MGDKDSQIDNDARYLGKTIEQWDNCWRLLPEGFTDLQSNLRRSVGLWGAKVGQDFIYIASATQIDNGGLREGLARVRLGPQSINNTGALKSIKNWPVPVDAYVLVVSETKVYADIITKIRDKMIELHRPKLNVPSDIIKAAIKESYNK